MVQLDTDSTIHERARTRAAARPVALGGFQLLVDPTRGASAGTVHAVPAGVSFLLPEPGALALSSELPAGAAASALMLEPVRLGGSSRLLVAALGAARALRAPGAPAPRVRVNGAPAPVVALLRVADALCVGDVSLHVTEYRDGRPGPPAPELVGRPCALCRLPIAVHSRIYLCPCGVALHLEGDEKPVADRLECARVAGECPECQATVNTRCEAVWTPENWS